MLSTVTRINPLRDPRSQLFSPTETVSAAPPHTIRIMARRAVPVRAFVPKQTSNQREESETVHATIRKEVWSPAPSVQTLLDKMRDLEERLDHLEELLCFHTDLSAKKQKQEEVEQTRQELQSVRQQLSEAMRRLEERETELQDTQHALDNLTNQASADHAKIQDLQAENKALHQLVKDLEHKLNERSKKVQQLEKQTEKLQRHLSQTNQVVGILQTQMNEMQQQMASIMAQGITPGTVVPGPVRSGSSPRPASDTLSQTSASSGQRVNGPVQTSFLGLPPIPLPQQTNGRTTRGNVKLNFPPAGK